MEGIGDRLRTWRKAAGYTVEYAAEKLAVTIEAFLAYEQDEKMPPLSQLIELGSLYDVSMDRLLGLQLRRSISIEGLTADQVDLIQFTIYQFRFLNSRIREPEKIM